MAKAFIASISAGSSDGLFNGSLVTANGEDAGKFADQAITAEDGTPVKTVDDCGIGSFIKFNDLQGAGPITKITRLAACTLDTKTFPNNDVATDIRRAVRAVGLDDTKTIGKVVIIKG